MIDYEKSHKMNHILEIFTYHSLIHIHIFRYICISQILLKIILLNMFKIILKSNFL